MIELEAKDDGSVAPRCPHCNTDVRTIWYRKIRGTLGQRYVYFCSSCRAVLGVSHRKGFWMG